MPVDYSKWDALEISDDSDIEVHPNVDKRSFIRAKQNQIHAERQHRRHQIETLKYERQVNDGLLSRISGLLSSLRAHADDAKMRNAAEVAFQAVMESGGRVKPEDDAPPPRPEGIHANVEQPPTYTKMMASLLDQVNKTMEEKKVESEERYSAMIKEIESHLAEVQSLQSELEEKLAELEKEEGSKITSESIHTGFSSSHVNKASQISTASDAAAAATTTTTTGGGSSKNGDGGVELLNPGFSGAPGTEEPRDVSKLTDEEMEASADGKKFGEFRISELRESMTFIQTHPQILSQQDEDGLMVMGFNAALEGEDELSRQYLHQAIFIQYCRRLGGRDGAALFFKRISTGNHQAREMFYKDVQEQYMHIKSRAKAMNEQRARDEAEGKLVDGVEQIQLHAVDPGTVISIKIPAADAEDEETKQARAIFESFEPEMRQALETGELDQVNKVLGEMTIDDAEELVGKFGEAGVLSVEEEIIDATTEQGQAQLKQIERDAAATTSEEVIGDPE